MDTRQWGHWHAANKFSEPENLTQGHIWNISCNVMEMEPRTGRGDIAPFPDTWRAMFALTLKKVARVRAGRDHRFKETRNITLLAAAFTAMHWFGGVTRDRHVLLLTK